MTPHGEPDYDHLELYYDRAGRPLTMDEWAKLHADLGYRRIARDEVAMPDGQEVAVSTVWLGLDHGFGGEGGPLIFETMAFGAGPWDEFQRRYSTEEEAKTGHAFVVSAVERGKVPDDDD